jgi:MFS family permease
VEPGSALDVPGDAAQSEAEARRNLPFNFGVLLAHGLLGQTGFRLVNAPTFLPHYVSILAGNNRAVGLVRAVQSLGMFLSPVLSARIVEHRRRVRGLALLVGGAMRLQFLLLAVIALAVPTDSALGLVLLVMALFGVFLGMQGVIFNFMMSKTIPVDRRGRLLGLRNAASGVTLLAVSGVAGYFIDRYGFPAGYGYTFLTGFLLTSLGLAIFALIREPVSYEVRESVPVLTRVRAIPDLLRAEPDFRRFLVARLLGTAARGALPFYVIFVGLRFEISGERLAVLTIAFTVAQSLSGLAWGLMADRTGFRAVFVAALLTWITGTALLVLPWSLATYAVFLLVGIGFSGFMLSSQNLVLEFGTLLDRPLRIATANSLSELVGMVGFLGAGLLADLVPLAIVFWTASALQVCALLAVRRVADPRIPVAPSVSLDV